MHLAKQLYNARLTFKKPGVLPGRLDLLADNTPVGAIVFADAAHTRATATLANFDWTFERRGFWKPTIEIRPADRRFPALRAGYGRGISGLGTALDLPGRGVFHLKSKSFWSPSYAWYNAQGQAVLELSQTADRQQPGLAMRLLTTGLDDATVALLLLLGGFQMALALLADGSGGEAALLAGI